MALSLQSLQPQNFKPVVAPSRVQNLKTLAEFEAAGQQQQFRGQQIQQNEQEMKAQEAAMQEASAIHDALMRAGGDFEAALPEIAKTGTNGAKFAFEIGKQLAAEKRQVRDDEIKRLEIEGREFGRIAQLGKDAQEHELNVRKQDETENQNLFSRLRTATQDMTPKQDTGLTPFEVWKQQNPNAPVSEFYAMEAQAKPNSGRTPVPGVDIPYPEEVEKQRTRMQATRSANDRPVTSGDAGRIADFDTALNDLSALSTAIPAGTTGTWAKVGAKLPNFVTNATGIGSEAKQKQAVIDRVKQVIGKTLEGGVLRKEDEIKYEKILPTIYDNDDLVKSKLQGLTEAIKKRKTTFIDTLSDSGYDVSKHRVRAGGNPNGGGLIVPGGALEKLRGGPK